jgi:hypothetical protein
VNGPQSIAMGTLSTVRRKVPPPPIEVGFRVPEDEDDDEDTDDVRGLELEWPREPLTPNLRPTTPVLLNPSTPPSTPLLTPLAAPAASRTTTLSVLIPTPSPPALASEVLAAPPTTNRPPTPTATVFFTLNAPPLTVTATVQGVASAAAHLSTLPELTL